MQTEKGGLSRSTALQMEYSALRDEILKRMDLRQQFVAMTLTIAGVFLGVGVTTASVALVYPALAAFLAIGWVQNDLRIRHLGTYIRDHVEASTPDLGWQEHYDSIRRETQRGRLRFTILSHTGVFLFTQLMAIGVGILKFTHTPTEWVFLAIDLFAVLTVLWVARMARR
jgi:hypothetical protein